MTRSTVPILYELTVHDDGVAAVRKCRTPTLFGLYTVLKSPQDLRAYLAEWLETRTPLDEIMGMIDDAPVGEWVEFK